MLLVGDGDLRENIVKQIETLKITENVRLLGFRNDVVDLLHAMDLFVFPSLYEGFGISAIEAQALGLPVVASDTVPQEIAITDLVIFRSLRKDPGEWAEDILKWHILKEERVGRPSDIEENGYSVEKNSKWLMNYYYHLLHENINWTERTK